MFISVRSRLALYCLVLAGITAVFVGCARKPVRFQNVGYNRGLEDSENKMLLLNAVRASKRYPMYFSASDSLTGKHTTRGTLDAQLPFTVRKDDPGTPGQVELRSFRVDPSVFVEGGFSSHGMANLMTARFMRAIITDVEVKQLKFYLDQGWPEEVIFFMMIQEIGLSRKAEWELRDDYTTLCRNGRYNKFKSTYSPPPNVDVLCARINADYQRFKDLNCRRKDIKQIRAGKNSPYPLLIVENNPRKTCSFLAFSAFVRTMRLLKVRIDSKTEGSSFVANRKITKIRNEKGPSANSFTENTQIKERKSGRTITQVILEIPRKGSTTFEFGGALSDAGGDTFGYMALRSPRDMLYFLGANISAQLRKLDSFTPTILVGAEQEEVPLFKIHRGIIDKLIGAAVSVKHEGLSYSIPRPGVGDIAEHRSMQALALVRQLITKGVERDELPKSSTVIVGG